MLFYNLGDMKGAGDFEDHKQAVIHNFHHSLNHNTPTHHNRESNSDDVDSQTTGGFGSSTGPLMSSPPSQSNHKRQKKDAACDGASIELVRRPRGRPPGSKNKQKPPVVITQEAAESPAALRPHVLEIPAGHDVAAALSGFCRRRNLGLAVLAATGAVSNVTFRQPSAASPAAGVTFHGRFDILSLAATFFPPSFSSPIPNVPFSVSIAGPQGQIFGGVVVGPLMAAGTVTVVAAAFSNPTLERIPPEEELSVSGDGGSGGRDEAEEEQQEQQQLKHVVGGSSSGAPAAAMVESSPMSIFSCHMPSDVMWSLPGRAAHPPPPPY